MNKLIVFISIIVIYYLFSSGVLIFDLSDNQIAPPKLTPTEQVLSTGPTLKLDPDKLWSVIQNWRRSQNLQPYIEDQSLCSLAEDRLREIRTDFSHAGFARRNLQYHASENLISGYYPEEDALEGWLDSPTHRHALEADYKFSCVRTNSTYAVQIFANF